jgi:hypothetical protein
MNRSCRLAPFLILVLILSSSAFLNSAEKTATVRLRIVDFTSLENLGVAEVATFEREYGDIPSGNLAARFRQGVARDIPYAFYKLCARTTGFWTACTEVPVYQPKVWVVLGLRPGLSGPSGLSGLAGAVRGTLPGKSAIWVRLMGAYSGITTDAEVGSSGRFQMSGIPDGEYVLITIQAKRIVDTRPVHIPTDGPIEIDLHTQE